MDCLGSLGIHYHTIYIYIPYLAFTTRNRQSIGSSLFWRTWNWHFFCDVSSLPWMREIYNTTGPGMYLANSGINYLLLMEKSLHQLRLLVFLIIFCHYLQGFLHSRWCSISSINSINWCRLHQPYVRFTLNVVPACIFVPQSLAEAKEKTTNCQKKVVR